MTISGSKSSLNRELAREALIKCVNRRRRQGLGTMAALDTDAAALGISVRKARKIFFQEENQPMSAAERHTIRMGVVRVGRRMTAAVRIWCDEVDAQLDLEEQEEMRLWQRDISLEPGV